MKLYLSFLFSILSFISFASPNKYNALLSLPEKVISVEHIALPDYIFFSGHIRDSHKLNIDKVIVDNDTSLFLIINGSFNTEIEFSDLIKMSKALDDIINGKASFNTTDYLYSTSDGLLIGCISNQWLLYTDDNNRMIFIPEEFNVIIKNVIILMGKL